MGFTEKSVSGGFTKKQYIGGLAEKGATRTVCRLKGAWQERGDGVFEGFDTPMHIWVFQIALRGRGE